MYSIRSSFYNHEAAVNYAVKFALHPNPIYRYFPLRGNSSGDCANFLSQCIFTGGAPMSYNSKNQWWYNRNTPLNINDDSWSISWSVAHSLFWLLKINYKSNLSGPKGLEVSTANLLQPGDLIFFEDGKGLIFHSAIVTSSVGGTPLISHHSFEALNIPIYRSYQTLKLHYLKISV
jgi:cell wall-associated NlpC family hydrolase